MGARGPQITALMISPNRRIADEFLESLGRGRAFEIVADLAGVSDGRQISIHGSGSCGPTSCCWMWRPISMRRAS